MCDLIYNGAVSCLISPSMLREMKKEINGKLHTFTRYLLRVHMVDARRQQIKRFQLMSTQISLSLKRTNSKRLTHGPKDAC